MALNQLREWLIAPYSKNSCENGYKDGCENSSPLSDVDCLLHRRMLVISGRDAFCDAALSIIQTLADDVSLISVATFTGDALKGKKRKKVLGSEYDIATLDCREAFKPGDAMAVAGIVKHQGCLVLMCPELDDWSSSASVPFISEGFTLSHSRYITRFIKHLRTNRNIALLSESIAKLPDLATYQAEQTACQSTYRGSLFKSKDQENAYERLYQSYLQNKLNGLVTAPRGRGKSSLLGIFIGAIVREGKNVLLTSEQRENVANVLSQVHRFDETKGTSNQVHQTGSVDQKPPSDDERRISLGSVKWVPPDSELLYRKNNTTYDLVVVDEAASMPIPTLNRIMAHNPQWVLSTTLHGYEGSGNGFIHKLIPKLPEGSTHLTLSTPMRWYKNDLIETFFNSTCLFESSSESDGIPSVELEDTVKLIKTSEFCLCTFENLDESTLQQVMSLLALAHYQTTPDDFMRLMDSPDVLVATLKSNNLVLAAVIVNIEGGFRLTEVSMGIASGHRRPKGHLSAQRLTLLSAAPETATNNYWRINRIAVHPKVQGRGLGSYVVKEVVSKAREQFIDATCTSYGTTLELDNFWVRNGFEIVDYGRKPNKASGETSALAVLPLSQKTKVLVNNLILLKSSFGESNLGGLSDTVLDIYVTKLAQFTQGSRTLDDVWPILNKLSETTKYANQIKVQGINKDCGDTHQVLSNSRKTINQLIKIININDYLATLFYCSDMDTKRIVETLKTNGIKLNGLKEATALIRTTLSPAFN